MYNKYIIYGRVRIITKNIEESQWIVFNTKNIDSKLDKINEVTEVHIHEETGDFQTNKKY